MSEAKISPLREQDNFNLQTTDFLHERIYALHKMKKRISPAVFPLCFGDTTITPPFLLPFCAVPNSRYNEGICWDESAIMPVNTGYTPEKDQDWHKKITHFIYR